MKALLEDDQSRGRIVAKTQSKRETYRVLGKSAEESLHKETDPNIYNDHDFYQVLLADFLKAHEFDNLDKDSDFNEEEEKRFLGNADIGLTQRFLQKR